MVTSAFSKFDFRPVISISGLLFYTYVCYIQFWFIQFYWLWHRPLYRLPRPVSVTSLVTVKLWSSTCQANQRFANSTLLLSAAPFLTVANLSLALLLNIEPPKCHAQTFGITHTLICRRLVRS